MTTVQPEGERIRKAAQWVAETRKYEPQKTLNRLIEEASVKFDLSPLEVEFLKRFVKAEGL